MADDLDMEIAALLPDSDPLRQAWEQKLPTLPSELQARWRRLLLNACDLRLELLAVSLPEGLLESLRSPPSFTAELPQAEGEARVGAAEEDAGAGGENRHLDLDTAALLPPHDPLRQHWERLLPSASPELQALWRQRLQQADALRTSLQTLPADQEAPRGLHSQLQAIPPGQAARPGWRGWHLTTPWKWAATAAAAMLLFLAGTALYRLHLAAVDRRSLAAITAPLVAQHPAPPGLLIESDDARIVGDALRNPGITGMQPIIIEYRRGGTHLLGGGITTLHGQQVYFTTWRWRNQPFTLYQFRPAPLGLRPNFVEHHQSLSNPHALPVAAPSPTQPAGPTHIFYWSEPSYGCGWALITTGPTAENPFIW